MQAVKRPWYVYIVRCSDNTLYTGITTDLDRRMAEHNSTSNGARYTRTRRPVTLLYNEACVDRSEASKREAELKRLSREEKEDVLKNR